MNQHQSGSVFLERRNSREARDGRRMDPRRDLRQRLDNDDRGGAADRGRERSRRPRVQLDLEQIVDAALEIADRDGPEAMTMRAIASALGVGVMSLYWYVPTKRDLEALVLERLMRDSSPPFEPTGDWRRDLASIAYAARENMNRHPWMIDLFSRAVDISSTAFGHGFLRHIENTMRMAEGLPLSFSEKMSIITLIDNSTMGFVFDEIIERRRLAEMGMTEEDFHSSLSPRIHELLEEHDYPLFRNFMAHDHELPDRDQQFEQGLQLILDGVAAQIERARDRGASGRPTD